MQTLIIFTYKVIKTFFVLPWIFFDLLKKNTIQTTRDILTVFQLNLYDMLFPIFEIFSLEKVISYIK